MTDFFIFLVETNLITAAFVIGAIAFIVAIIGRIKTIIEPTPVTRIILALFGLFLMFISISGYFVANKASNESSSNPIVETESPEDLTVTSAGAIDPFCPFLTKQQIEDLKNIQGVSSAITAAEEFSEHQQNDYKSGEIIPINVLIATDLRTSNIDQFKLVPINNQGGWGLFLTTIEFQAPNDGTYWCIQE